MTRQNQKQQQRDAAFARRASIISGDAAKRASRQFLDNIKDIENKTVSLYWPLGSELDTKPLLHALHDIGVTCALPVVENKHHPLSFRRWTPETVMELGAFKVLVPAETAANLVPDIVITPMLAFDARGYRLGYGGGFYDRTLAKLRNEGECRAIGFAYAAQEVAEVVIDRFDQRLDSIITEKDVRIIK